MSEGTMITVANIDERAQLLELIAAKKGKGGSKSDRARFSSLWVSLAKKSGVNDETIEILFKGFSIADAQPFYRYVYESRDQAAYSKFFSSQPVKANEAGTAFKAELNLFAFELVTPSSRDALEVLSRAIPNASLNKEGKVFGILGQSVSKLLVKPLAKKAINVEARIQASDALRLLSLLGDAITKAGSRADAQSFESRAAITLLSWLKRQAGRGEIEKQDSDKNMPDVDMKSANAPSSDANSSQSDNMNDADGEREDAVAAKKEATASPMPRSDSPVLDMTLVLQYLSGYQTNYERLLARNEELRAERKSSLQEISGLKLSLKNANDKIAEMREQISSLSERQATLQMTLNTTKDELESTGSELAAAQQMLATINQRDNRQANEAANRLAAKLQVEYQDFLDAADLPMSADLGENMRDQLRSVFEILAANGVEL